MLVAMNRWYHSSIWYIFCLPMFVCKFCLKANMTSVFFRQKTVTNGDTVDIQWHSIYINVNDLVWWFYGLHLLFHITKLNYILVVSTIIELWSIERQLKRPCNLSPKGLNLICSGLNGTVWGEHEPSVINDR